jgi:hypothetical protein
MAGIAVALSALTVGMGSVAAQERTAEDVTIANEALFTQKVFVVDAEGEFHLLGRVAPGEIATFDVPAAVERLGRYRIAFQELPAPPGLGVPASEPPMRMAAAPLLEQGKLIILIGVNVVSTVEAF